MGLLARMRGVAPQKAPTDDILLIHAMLLMAGADGGIDDEEIATVSAFAETLSEFKGKDFGELVEGARKMLRKYDSLKDSVKALSGFSTPAMGMKAYVLAADIALSSGDVDENEDELLETMQRLCNVDDRSAQTIIWVLQQKYAT